MGLRQEGYWDHHYELELKNFEEDGDEGEVWFGKGLSRRIGDWLIEKLTKRVNQSASVIDVGCGNAFFLYTLSNKYCRMVRQEDLTNLRLLGIDYSQKSIELSRKIVDAKGLGSRIDLRGCDFLDGNQVTEATDGAKFDFIIDKGTFDAICLLNQNSIDMAKLSYLQSLDLISRHDSTFILASCNHTEEELLSLFKIKDSPITDPVIIDRIETPKIQFGGKEGSQVTCLIFELRGARVKA